MNTPRLMALITTLLMVLAACAPVATPSPAATAGPAPTKAAQATATPTPAPPVGATATPTPKPAAAPAQAKPKYGGVLKVDLTGDLEFLDPFKVTGGKRRSRQSFSWVFTRLFTAIPTVEEPCVNKVTPEIGESYRWLDDTTLEVKLRPGVKYFNVPPVNGREVVASDFIASIYRVEDPETMNTLESVRKIEAVDKYTLRFYLKNPSPSFVWDLLAYGYTVIVAPPEAADAKLGYSLSKERWIGSGPMMFEEYQPGVKITYKRNPSYFKEGLPYLDGVEMPIMPEQSTRVAAFIAGKIDMATRINIPNTAMFKSRYKEFQAASCMSGTLRLWPKVGAKAFDDVRVRRAIAMAIDHQGIIKSVLLGQGRWQGALLVGENPHALSLEEYPPEVRKYLEYRPDEAKRLLAEAGYPNGFDTTLTWTTFYGSPYNEMAEAVVSALVNVGISVKMNIVPYGEFLSSPMMGKYTDLGLFRMTYSTSEDSSFYSRNHTLAGGGSNHAGSGDAAQDKMIDQFRTSLDENKRAQLARAIQINTAEQAYYVNLPAAPESAFAKPYVKNFTYRAPPFQFGQFLERVWLDK